MEQEKPIFYQLHLPLPHNIYSQSLILWVCFSTAQSITSDRPTECWLSGKPPNLRTCYLYTLSSAPQDCQLQSYTCSKKFSPSSQFSYWPESTPKLNLLDGNNRTNLQLDLLTDSVKCKNKIQKKHYRPRISNCPQVLTSTYQGLGLYTRTHIPTTSTSKNKLPLTWQA